MPHFKAFGKRNLQYEISICQILYNKGTGILLSVSDGILFPSNQHYKLKNQRNS